MFKSLYSILSPGYFKVLKGVLTSALPMLKEGTLALCTKKLTPGVLKIEKLNPRGERKFLFVGNLSIAAIISPYEYLSAIKKGLRRALLNLLNAIYYFYYLITLS
jgi:hypothetical protein